MLTALAVLLFAAPPSLAAPSFTAVGVQADKVSFLQEHLAQELSRHGLRVLTEREVASVLGLERQRQLLNCEEEKSCALELAGALGVEAVLLGNVARLDQLLVVDLKVISAREGRRLASLSVRASNEVALLDQLDAGARSIAEQLGALAPAAVTNAPSTPGGPPRWVGVVAAGAGLALGVTSVVFAEKATAAKRGLSPELPVSLSEGARLRDAGKEAQTAAVALGLAGGALLVAGALVAWSPWQRVAVAITPTGTGAHLVVGGAFP